MQRFYSPTTSSSRSGFTLIELLVAISIIVLIMGLFAPAVMNTLTNGQVVEVQGEMTQLEQGIGDFKMTFGDIPPSTFTIREADTGWTNAERSILRRFWPNYDFSTANSFDANGDGDETDEIVMNGGECLVFFLGGILNQDAGVPVNRIPSGFSKNPAAPFQLGGSRVGPFTEFDTDRLTAFDTDSNGNTDNDFKMLVDPSSGGSPYMYINSRDYNSPAAALEGSGMSNVYTQDSGGTVYWKAQTYQLISAGSDGTYGQGGLFNAETSDSDLTGPRDSERDNITNFHNGLLAP